ncbi:EamA family transporter [Nostoc sp. FACHB-152]|uniref:EamA family transporter n=1 Tax=unclassified Nostoc TaxID=2593658 RepID=UPI00168463F9|nr:MULTISPECIES: EamA family transporter [unclassified Nostoc]MBD2446503.1 EamA family transporter [Nostoc sp. FACHB-152]MBD2468700.1 EamA family transporter [Nostoc sp. FACHB-145]
MFQVDEWLIYTLISSVLYGVWGFCSKMAANYITPKSALGYEAIGFSALALFVMTGEKLTLNSDIRGVIYATLVGVTGAVASLFLFIALSKGNVSIIIPITALYPIITIIMAYFILKEPITFRQSIGLMLALAAVVLCADVK